MTDTSRMDRRLRVVLFADIVGYTQLSSTDERTAIGVAGTLHTVADEVVNRRNGRVVKHLGDGLVAAFDGARHGTEAALELCAAFELATSGLPGGPHRLRLGLHMGEITETESGDVFGDAVNRASRIQSEAEPGEVFVSEAMTGLLRQDRRFDFEDRGERFLKGIAEPVHVFRVQRLAPGAVAARPPVPVAGTASAASPHSPSSALLASMAGSTDKPVTTHPLRDQRVRRWALAMGTTVALGAFSFLIVGTGAFSSFGGADGELSAQQFEVTGTPNEPTAAAELPARGATPTTTVEADQGVERPSAADAGSRNPVRPAVDAATDRPTDIPAAEPQVAEAEPSEARPALTDAEAERLYELLFTDAGAVASRMGLRAPVDEREEMLRITALILSGQDRVALRRLEEFERLDLAENVRVVDLAYLHFRAENVPGAARLLSDAGMLPEESLLDAGILRARIAGVVDGPAAAFDALERVPERVRDDVWRGWRSYYELAKGTDEPGGALLRSLGGRKGSAPSEARRYVNALLMHQLNRGEMLARGIIDDGRKELVEEFLWVGTDPEWRSR